MNAPLPAMTGHVLHEVLHAGEVWTIALWSAAVLSAHSCSLDGRSWLNELKWLASNRHPPLRSGGGSLQAGQVAVKLLVMTVEGALVASLVCSALPYDGMTPVLDLDDDQSCDQYSLLSNPDLNGPHWNEDMWELAWAEAYSANFLFHICLVAGDDASVLCLYSLACCSLFF